MHPNEELLNNFYNALGRRDYETMNACYHPEATFRDPVFELQGKEIQAMWHMLCERGTDLEVSHSGVEADDTQGVGYCEAHYTFSKTGRKIHNKLYGAFTFKNGKILTHRDRFNFHRWCAMALGPVGMLLGWTPFIQKKVRAEANKSLEIFIKRHPEYHRKL